MDSLTEALAELGIVEEIGIGDVIGNFEEVGNFDGNNGADNNVDDDDGDDNHNGVDDEEEEEEDDDDERGGVRGRGEGAGEVSEFEAVNRAAVDGFDLLRARPVNPRLERLPGSLKVGLWNCRGIRNKEQVLRDLLQESGADVLVLNETMRPSMRPWPSYLPACAAEATREQRLSADDDGNPRRNPGGVAVLVSDEARKPSGAVQKIEVLAVDNVLGTKVIIRVNDLILFGVYCPPNAEGYELLLQYAAEAAVLARSDPVVFCGDLNLHMTDDDVGEDATKVARFKEALGPDFVRAATGSNFSRPANRIDAVNEDGRNLDHFFVAGLDALDGEVLVDYSDFSDHRPLMVGVVLRQLPSINGTKYWRLRLEKLREAEPKQAYAEAVAGGVDALRDEIHELGMAHMNGTTAERLSAANAIEKRFSKFLLDAARRALGRKRVPVLPSPIKPKEPSPEYRLAKANFKLASLRLHSLIDDDGDAAEIAWRRQELLEQRQALNAVQLAENQRGVREFNVMLNELPLTPKLKLLNRMRRRNAAAGTALPTSPADLVAHRDHFARQFRNDFGVADEPLAPLPGLDAIAEEGVKIFDEAIVQAAIERSPLGKAPGMTGVCAELLAPVSAVIAGTVCLIFRLYFGLQVVPSSWTRALVCPVPKKGDLSRISNYRPISLTEVLRKIFEMCLLDRLKEVVPLSAEQGGFRAGRSCYDQVEALQLAVKQLRQRPAQRPHLAFLDIKAAYDSVPRGELWRRLGALEVPSPLVGILRALFDHNSAQLVIGGKRSPEFGLPAGVLQGSVLSPLLYSVYIDPLVEKLRSGPLIPFQEIEGGLNCLLYADDVVLIAKSGRHLKLLLELAEEDSLARGYRFSPTKCAVISNDNVPKRLYNADVPSVKSFCYLGIDFNASGVDEIAHAKRRAAKAEASVKSLNRIGARSSVLSARSLVQLYKTIVRPGLEYGLPLLTTKKGALVILENHQLKLLKEMMRLPRFSLNDLVFGLTACPPMRVRQTVLRFSRLQRLRGRWSTEWWVDDLLVVARKGWEGEDFPEDRSLPRPGTEKLVILNDLFIEPVDQMLRSRFDGELSFAILQKLMKLKISSGLLRLFALWFVQSWRSFKTRTCKRCSGVVDSQSHVLSCTQLLATLDADHSLPRYAPLDPPRPRSASLVVEERVRAIVLKRQPRKLAISQLEALGQHLCSALEAVYGPRNRLTYV